MNNFTDMSSQKSSDMSIISQYMINSIANGNSRFLQPSTASIGVDNKTGKVDD
jgi:hypothetical protein